MPNATLNSFRTNLKTKMSTNNTTKKNITPITTPTNLFNKPTNNWYTNSTKKNSKQSIKPSIVPKKYTLNNKMNTYRKIVKSNTDKNSIIDIISQIDSMEGPVSAQLMQPTRELNQALGRTAPVLLLLGDIHVGSKTCDFCTAETGCYSLYKANMTFLQHINDTIAERYQTDLFLEMWDSDRSVKGFTYENTYHNSALINMTEESIPCRGRNKGDTCYKKIRIHDADVRKIKYDSKYPAESQIYSLVELFKSKDDIKTYNNILKSRFYSPWKLVDPTINISNIPRVISDFTTYITLLSSRKTKISDILNNPFYQKYSRTYHEIKQLPENIRRKIIEKADDIYFPLHMDIVYPLLDDYRDNLISYVKNMHDPSKTKNISPLYIILLDTMTDGISNFSLFGVDVYTISRALKSFGNNPSQFSIIYLGNKHIKRITSLLEEYYTIKQQWGKPNLNISQVNNLSTLSKCITKLKDEFTISADDAFIRTIKDSAGDSEEQAEKIAEHILDRINKNVFDYLSESFMKKADMAKYCKKYVILTVNLRNIQGIYKNIPENSFTKELINNIKVMVHDLVVEKLKELKFGTVSEEPFPTEIRISIPSDKLNTVIHNTDETIVNYYFELMSHSYQNIMDKYSYIDHTVNDDYGNDGNSNIRNKIQTAVLIFDLKNLPSEKKPIIMNKLKDVFKNAKLNAKFILE